MGRSDFERNAQEFEELIEERTRVRAPWSRIRPFFRFTKEELKAPVDWPISRTELVFTLAVFGGLAGLLLLFAILVPDARQRLLSSVFAAPLILLCLRNTQKFRSQAKARRRKK